MSAEFFRYLRPQWFNRDRVTIEPLPMGGISFLVNELAWNKFQFWIYIVPYSSNFSKKQAVKSLRKIRNSDVVPFGQFTPTADLLIDQLTAYLINEKSDLVSEASKMALDIYINNVSCETQKRAYMKNSGMKI